MDTTAKATTANAPGIHQRRPKRRSSAISSVAPAAAITAEIAADLPLSNIQSANPWVESPKSTARSCATAWVGSAASPSASERPAPAAAAPSSGRRPSASSRRLTARGRPSASVTSRPVSIASVAKNSSRWPER